MSKSISNSIHSHSKMDIQKMKQVLNMLSQDKKVTAHKIAATLTLVQDLCEVVAKQEHCEVLTNKMRKESRELLSVA